MIKLGYLLTLETNTLPTHFIMTFSHPALWHQFGLSTETAIEVMVLDTLFKKVGAAHSVLRLISLTHSTCSGLRDKRLLR